MGWLKNGTLDEYLIVNDNGEYSYDDIAQVREQKAQFCGKQGSYAVGCFGKIINDGWKMDY